MTLVSIILPVFDEEENIPLLAERVVASAKRFPPHLAAELIFVDDGSADGSLAAMREARAAHPEAAIRILKRAANGGLSAAMATGFAAARGEMIVTLDADLQNDPDDIPRLLEALSACDAAVGVRERRADPLVKRVSSRIANAIRNLCTGDRVRDTGCSLKAYRAEAIRRVKMYDGMHRFLPTLLRMEGARVVELPVRHHPRLRGKAKYHLFNRLAGPFADLLAVMWMRARRIDPRAEEV